MINCLIAQVEIPNAPQWQVTFRVTDENGKPIPDANVYADYLVGNEVSSKKTGATDTNGLITLAAHSGPAIGYSAEQTGYYTTHSSYNFDFRNKAGGQWHPWNPTLQIVLKRIGNPIPMYAKHQAMKLQKEDEPLGFDLMVGDWVAPNGTGTNADMFFTVHRKIINEREYDCALSVTFPNKGDGIVAAPSIIVTGSEFKTSRTAAENGYESKLDLHYSNTNSPESVFGYFIRVRTELDKNGNVKSALYGKISGGFRFYAGTIKPHSGMGFDYYLNPTPNDRNLEFDPKHNLSTNLKLLEGVNEP